MSLKEYRSAQTCLILALPMLVDPTLTVSSNVLIEVTDARPHGACSHWGKPRDRCLEMLTLCPDPPGAPAALE